MPQFDTIHPVSHSPKHMYDLVAQVEAYPEFLPLCESLTVRSRRTKGNRELLVADMTVAYKLLRETFTSQVLLNPDELAIDVKYLDGPFRYLDNRWRFDETDTGCNVRFHIDYEFRSRALGLVMGSMFDVAFRRFAKAFEERADQIYA